MIFTVLSVRVQDFWPLLQSLQDRAPRGISVSSPHPDDCVPLFIRHPLIPSITLNGIPMWPLGASSASHFSNHCHWIALHSTGWHNTPVIRHEGHWLYTAAGPKKVLGGLFIYLFIFPPTNLRLKDPFFARLRFNKDGYLRKETTCLRLMAAHFWNNKMSFASVSFDPIWSKH